MNYLNKFNMNINWGNKRTHKEINDEQDNITKKQKQNNNNDGKDFFVERGMIYSVGIEIYFTEEINTETINIIIKKITEIIYRHKKQYNKNKKLNITYIVDSPGGCVHSILKFVDFIDTIRQRNKNITFTSIITGLVASAGTIMCIIADKRLITKNANTMIHELSTGSRGKYTQLMSYANSLTQMHNTLVRIYLSKVNITKEKLEDLLNRETWFSAEEYLELGFVEDYTTSFYKNKKDNASDDEDISSDSGDEFSDDEEDIKKNNSDDINKDEKKEECEEEEEIEEEYDDDNDTVGYSESESSEEYDYTSSSSDD